MVDISRDIEDARKAAATADGPFRELMALYVEFGELLESGRNDAFYVEDCAGFVDELVSLGLEMARWSEQRWFAWVAHNTTFGEAN